MLIFTLKRKLIARVCRNRTIAPGASGGSFISCDNTSSARSIVSGDHIRPFIDFEVMLAILVVAAIPPKAIRALLKLYINNYLFDFYTNVGEVSANSQLIVQIQTLLR